MKKACTKCGAEQDVSAFCKDSSKLDGLHPHCRSCRRARRKEYRSRPEVKAREDAYAKAYYSDPENKEKHAAHMAGYFQKNRAAYAARGDRWRAKPENAKKIIAYRRQDTVIAANKARTAAWSKKNPDARRAHFYNRLALKKRIGGKHTAADIKEFFSLQRGKCACCRASIKRGYHVDHIEPLARGGSNDRANIQLLCPTCNLRKGAKAPERWAAENGRLL